MANDKESNLKHLQYIDAAKGLAIVSIVLLHFENGIFPSQMNLFISAYMITMFYITAGWVGAISDDNHKNDDNFNLTAKIKRRWHQLMVPYIWWTIIILAFDGVLRCFHYYDTYFIAREAYKSITLRGIGTLWFLPALFGGSVLWFYTKKLNKWYVYALVLCAVLAYHYIYRDCFASRTDSIGKLIDSPFRAINAMGNAWIGIGAGYIFNKVFRRIENRIAFIIGFCLCVISYMIETKISLPSFIWTLSAPLLSPLGIILIFKAMEAVNILRHLLYPFIYWGKHSMALMVTHYSIIIVLCEIINEFIFGNNKLYGVISIVWFFIALFVVYILVELFEKKYPKIFGKQQYTACGI